MLINIRLSTAFKDLIYVLREAVTTINSHGFDKVALFLH